MSVYQTSKKIRYTLSIIFILLMSFIVGGTYLSQQKIDAIKNQPLVESIEIIPEKQ